MSQLDEAYLWILGAGLSSIRNVAPTGDYEYCAREAEHLHEIPNLIDLANPNPHIYYFTKMRVAYLDWVLQSDRESIREFVEMWYEPAWDQMYKIIDAMK